MKKEKFKDGWASALQIELDNLVWTDGSTNVYYYYLPNYPSGKPLLPKVTIERLKDRRYAKLERKRWAHSYTPIECAITKHHDLSGEPYYVVFWNGFGVVQSRDLDSLKKDVEQLVRIKKTKLWGK